MTQTNKFLAGIATLFLLVGIAVHFGDYPPHADAAVSLVHEGWGIAAPGANTDAITDLTASGRALRVTVQVGTGTVANLMVSRGGTEFALGLNGNTALTAGCLYTFDVYSIAKGDTVNFQVETDSAINSLHIYEIRE